VRVEVPAGRAYHLINHGPCCLITTGDGTRRNVAPINWTMPMLDDPPLVVMAVEPGIFTDELLQAAGEFVVNVMGEAHAAAVLACGRSSGRDGDKFSATGLTPAPAGRVKPPFVAQSVGHIECRVKEAIRRGDITLYVGEVLRAEAESDCFDGKLLIPEKARTLHHVGGGVFAVADRVVRVPRT
jgi:flavin reductase (DIM6/NTAB) family NADH-FMN oxidoreductase RutF